MSRIAVHATPVGARSVRAGHPWLFEGSIASETPGGEPGQLAVVFDPRRRFLGIGLYDPESPIRVRLLHHGDPTPVDDAFFAERLRASIERRRTLIDAADTDGYRLVHGENDQLPGLVVDRYAQVTVVKLDTRAWIAHLPVVVGALQESLPAQTTILRYSRSARPTATAVGPAEGTALSGPSPLGPVRFHEHGLELEADVLRGQKTGYFLDQRDNRARVRNLATGRRVLDVFSCTGGFSLAAAAGGATDVHSIDLSNDALAAARRNFAHNAQLPSVARCTHQTTVGDAFAVMTELARSSTRYDLVVVDPPSFAARQANVESGLRAYARLTRLALTLMAPRGILVQSSCSSRIGAEAFFAGIHAQASRQGGELQEIERTGHALDHPIGFPEGAYLKTLFARRR